MAVTQPLWRHVRGMSFGSGVLLSKDIAGLKFLKLEEEVGKW